jgi:hypothetical protein
MFILPHVLHFTLPLAVRGFALDVYNPGSARMRHPLRLLHPVRSLCVLRDSAKSVVVSYVASSSISLESSSISLESSKNCRAVDWHIMRRWGRGETEPTSPGPLFTTSSLFASLPVRISESRHCTSSAYPFLLSWHYSYLSALSFYHYAGERQTHFHERDDLKVHNFRFRREIITRHW